MVEQREMALGTMHFGTRLDEANSQRILDRYAELSGSWLDTSNNYAFWQSDTGFGGQSESVLGRWLATNAPNGPRSIGLKLSTKVGAQPRQAHGGDWTGGTPDWVEGLAPEIVRKALHGSLQRLGVEHIDCYWAHVEDQQVSAAELVTTFGELVQENSIGTWGVSNHPSWLLERLRVTADRLEVTGPTGYQQRYSYLQPSPGAPVAEQPLTHGMLTSDGAELLRREPALTGWVYTSLLRGLYDQPGAQFPPEYQHPGNDRRLAALRTVAEGRGLTPSQIVLAWLVGGTPALVPIVGVSSVAQLEQVWAGVNTELTSDERLLLDSAY